MLTTVERVLILKRAEFLRDVEPRHLLRVAAIAEEFEVPRGRVLYEAEDPANALYLVVEGRVRLSIEGRTTSEVGPGEAFGTWALVDDSPRGHRAECIEEGTALSLRRDDFWELAGGDVTLLQEMVRALARRLSALVSGRPEEARVEPEGTGEG